MNDLAEYMKHLEELKELEAKYRPKSVDEKAFQSARKNKKKKKSSKKEPGQNENPWNVKWMIE